MSASKKRREEIEKRERERECVYLTFDSMTVVLNLFKVATPILRGKNWRHIKNIQTTIKLQFLCEQVLNYMYQMLIVKDVNYLVTHRKKLATPWLRTTAL